MVELEGIVVTFIYCIGHSLYHTTQKRLFSEAVFKDTQGFTMESRLGNRFQSRFFFYSNMDVSKLKLREDL